MKPVLAIIVLLSVSIGWLCVADAGHRVHNNQVIVATQYAVPIAVPVAPYAGVAYQQVNKAPAPPPKSAEEIIADRVMALIDARQSGNVNAQGKVTAFGASCAACHRVGNEALGKPAFTTLAAMTDEQLIACEEAIDEGRMPQNKPAGPELAGELFREIRNERKARLLPRPQVQPQAAPQSEVPPTPNP